MKEISSKRTQQEDQINHTIWRNWRFSRSSKNQMMMGLSNRSSNQNRHKIKRGRIKRRKKL